MFMTSAGTINANINNSKYLSNIDAGNRAVEDGDDAVVVLTLYILCPKINEDVPIKKETIPRIFPDRLGMILIGKPRVVSCCVWFCCCASTGLLSMPTNDNIAANDNMSNNNMIKKLGINLAMILVKLDHHKEF